jgi:predicted aspartyl protease
VGEVYAEATFRGSKGREVRLRLLVDTGSTYTCIPGTVARALGVRSVGVVHLDLADGRSVPRAIGDVDIEIMGQSAPRRIVFGRRGDSSQIGVDTLQGLLLDVEPTTHRLRRRTTALAVSPRATRLVVKREPRRASTVS